MNKNEFLSRLRASLASLPKEERDAAMAYYEEFFDDAGEENEQSVIAEIGSPEELGKSIVEENNRENPFNQINENTEYKQNSVNAANENIQNNAYQNNTGNFNNENTSYNYSGYNANANGAAPYAAPQNQKRSNGEIALIIVLLVLSSPVWLGLLCGVLGIVVGIFGALIGLVAGIGGCAIAFLFSGFWALFTEPAVGIMLIGFAFICAGMFPLAICPLCKLAVKGASALGKQIGKLFGKITGRKEKAQ